VLPRRTERVVTSETVTTYGKLVVGQWVLDHRDNKRSDDLSDHWLQVTEIIAAGMDTPIDHDVVFYAAEPREYGEKREHRLTMPAHATCLVRAAE